MNKLIEKLYDETYSPKITPQTLLNNLKLTNYTAINYKKNNEFLVAYVNCYLQNAVKAEYRYYFKDDLLYKLESNIEDVLDVIYDRENEKEKLVNQLKGYSKSKYA